MVVVEKRDNEIIILTNPTVFLVSAPLVGCSIKKQLKIFNLDLA